MAYTGKLFVISAPSGTGKTTMIEKVLNRFENLYYSVSHTTRSPRKNERSRLDYFFISPEEFELKINQNYWLEWAKVHDHYYGTSKEFVKHSLEKGKNILLDIDVQGAQQIMGSGVDIVSIFIMPPCLKILSQRLKNRNTDSKEVIARRLENAKTEIAQKDLYKYIVVNDDLDKAVNKFCQILEKEMRKKR